MMAEKNRGEGGFDLKVDKNTSPAEAARLALRQEQRARKFYEDCARVMEHPAAKKMFEFLADEEKKHETLIQREIDNHFLQEM
jgi:rubrerythrin